MTAARDTPARTRGAPSLRAVLRRQAGHAAGVVSGWGLWHWRTVLVLGVLTLFSTGTPLRPGSGDLELLQPLAYHTLQFGAPLLFTVLWADRATDAGSPPWLAYGLAVTVTVVGGVWGIGHALWPVLGKADWWQPEDDVWLALNVGVFHALGVAAYAQWRIDRRLQQRLRASEDERLREQQQLAVARLLALQARVEPELLFDSLQRVQQRMTSGAQGADALLGDLITLLRALLPQGPQGEPRASHVARELELLRLSARVLEQPELQAPRLTLEVDPDTLGAELAPLVLVPLLRTLARGEALRWQLRIRRQGDRLDILIWAVGDGAGTRAALQAIAGGELQDRLRAVHGPGAVLAVEESPTPAVRIELPFVTHPDAEVLP